MWWCGIMPRQMGYIHCNYWLHWELSKIYEQLNSFSWNNKPSLVCTQLPLGLPKIVIQLDSGVVSFIWFCCNVVIKKILGHISVARTPLPVFKEFTRVCPNRNDCGIPPNLSEPWRSCGTKQWTATKYHPPPHTLLFLLSVWARWKLAMEKALTQQNPDRVGGKMSLPFCWLMLNLSKGACIRVITLTIHA